MREILNKMSLHKKAEKIRFFFTDVDGTLTDGNTYYSISGEAMKRFSHIDGTGFFLLNKAGIIPGIITGETSEIVKRRAEKLKLDLCFLGIQNKSDFISQFAFNHNILMEEIAYIGDDLNDLQLLKHVGLSFAANNAHHLVKSTVNICCSSRGGMGCFREAVEILLVLQKKDIFETFYRID